jgi:hypothetical protein
VATGQAAIGGDPRDRDHDQGGVASMTGTVLAYSDRRSASSLTAGNGTDRAEPWRVDR